MESQPKKEKTIGLYKLSEESKDYLESGNIEWTSTIKLLENGILEYKDGEKIVKTGTWNISCGESYNCVIDMGERVVPFAEKKGKFAILITVGDGDECKGIVYEKTE